ncbi:unnamed protein product [Knipowitschia caucasica]
MGDPTQVDTEYGIDWEDLSGYHTEGLAIPQAQLSQELTADEILHLPNPNGSFCDVLNVYSSTVDYISQIIG